MKLYDYGMAPNPRRVRIFLHEKGIKVPRETIDITKREGRTKEFLAKNPMGGIPVLELDDGTCISESVAICRYFEALQPEPPLFGTTPTEIAEVDMWVRRLELYLMFQVGLVWIHGHKLTAHLLDQNPATAEFGRARTHAFYDILDKALEGRDFIAAAKERSYLAAPHHIGWTGCDEEGHDPQVQTTWEICSCHGCYEHPNHPLGMRGEHDDQLVSAMLAKGHRFGFTASSDSHGLLWHHGESRKRDPYRTGLTAVQTEELSRNAVLEALRTRRCYATSGAKIWLDLEARSGERRWPMGSEIRRDEHEGIEIVAHARGNEPLSRIELVGAEGVLVGAEGQGPSATLTSDFEGPGFVYLRVVQSDGEYAWSSPIFVD